MAMDKETNGWARAERETPKQTSDRIIASMRRNAKAAAADRKRKK